MKPAHVFATLKPGDSRQSEEGDRSECVRCGILRAHRFGGGHVYAPAEGRFWERRRPECTPKEGR